MVRGISQVVLEVEDQDRAAFVLLEGEHPAAYQKSAAGKSRAKSKAARPGS